MLLSALGLKLRSGCWPCGNAIESCWRPTVPSWNADRWLLVVSCYLCRRLQYFIPSFSPFERVCPLQVESGESDLGLDRSCDRRQSKMSLLAPGSLSGATTAGNDPSTRLIWIQLFDILLYVFCVLHCVFRLSASGQGAVDLLSLLS